MPNHNAVLWCVKWTMRASIAARRTPVIISFGILAMTAGCSLVPSPAGGGAIVTQQSAPSYASACFYSDRSGTDRIAGGRVIHWCGPEPRAVF